MKVYQPMSGLHRPVVIDPQLPNFHDTKLDIHCVPGELLNDQEAGALCQKVQTLFENQGALVTTHLTAGRQEDVPGASGEPTPTQDAEPRTELTLELRARATHQGNHPLSWALCAVSLTVLPGVFESTFAQDLVIRDGQNGFLLVTDSLEGRLVTRFGFGPWASNALHDLFRDKEDRLGDEAASRDLSNDLYRQLSQLVFNAKMQAVVLQQATPVGADR